MYYLAVRKPDSSSNPYLPNRCLYFADTRNNTEFSMLTTLDHNTSIVFGSVLIGRQTTEPTEIYFYGSVAKMMHDRLNSRYIPKKSDYFWFIILRMPDL